MWRSALVAKHSLVSSYMTVSSLTALPSWGCLHESCGELPRRAPGSAGDSSASKNNCALHRRSSNLTCQHLRRWDRSSQRHSSSAGPVWLRS